MRIGPFIKKEYFTVNAYQGTSQARKMIFEHGCAVVLAEDAKPIGIITPYDLAARQHHLVIDCLTDKPKLAKSYFIPDVLEVMEKVHSDVLLVYNGGDLEGIVQKKDLTDYLCRSVEQQKTLVHSIAHDLKNPLSNVLSMTYLMEDLDASVEHRELVALAQDACHYATGIINDLLSTDANNKGVLNKEKVEINTLIAECIDFFRIAIEQKELQLNTLIETDGVYIDGDKIKLKRAFCNLISNAIKFTPAGGTISIHALHKENGVLLMIKDNGVGIPVDMQEHIFEKFTSAKRRGTNGEESTGLGMFITRQIILQHGGEIWLESNENQGSTFYVQFNHHSIIH